MKISYNWLKTLIDVNLPATEVEQLLTNSGLEVEGMEEIESIKGGLEGLVIGEVKECIKHPNADKLSLTTVEYGEGDVQIVCGAPNVKAGIKVIVAPVGTTIHPVDGEPFTIKKAKMRGEESNGMLCAEDEIGMGKSHDGLLILPDDAKVGTPLKEFFKVENDIVFEIGLTPNRGDATSHLGVARDLFALTGTPVNKPDVSAFKVANNNLPIEVVIENTEACPRYSGVSISGVTVKPSPDWLQNRMRAIGLNPINNIVDATNYILHELGQPIHAFDADQIKGKKIIVKNAKGGEKFTTLDEEERTLTADNLMICDAESPSAIAGVFGGLGSGVMENTKNIFIESAYFNPASVRKTAKQHGLNTDASFRYERGTDPNITVYAAKRIALLIQEIAGGEVSSEIVDVYPNPVEDFKVSLNFDKVNLLAGQNIDKERVKSILTSLEMTIDNETSEGIELTVPAYRSDVTRDVDVIEDILRIYGYNNIEIPTHLNSSLSYSPKPDREALYNRVANYLTDNGFNELMTNSLTKADYYTEAEQAKAVKMLNPLSTDLNIMRQNLLYTGLESIQYNLNRKQNNLKFYEFGKVYEMNEDKYSEATRLALFVTGDKHEQSWIEKDAKADYFFLKGYLQNIFKKLGLNQVNPDWIVMQQVTKKLLKQFDINQEVYYAELNWDKMVRSAGKKKFALNEVPKFPEVRKDLSLVLDKAVTYGEIEELAHKTERKFLKSVNLFDVFEGKQVGEGKKSYSVSFILQNEEKTMSDKDIDKIMSKFIATFEKDLGAVIRK